MMALTINTYEKIAEFIHNLVHDVCNGKWIALGGGGYSPDVVGKAWTLYFATMAEKKDNVKEKVPSSWIELCKNLIRKTPSENLYDDFDPIKRFGKENCEKIKNAADDLIDKIKELIFPYFNLK